jgi:hypothetical protein
MATDLDQYQTIHKVEITVSNGKNIPKTTKNSQQKRKQQT